MSAWRNRTALTGALVTLVLGASGCVFVPLETVDGPTAEARLDAGAPRLPPLETRRYEALPESTEVLGEMQVLFSRYEDTFVKIARQYDVGYDALRAANPGVDHWLPGEQTPIFLPTRSILPAAPKRGIAINLPSMRLYYFTDDDDDGGLAVTTYPIGIGREGWATPTGTATVTQKARDPVWYPPISVRQEHAANGDPLPSVVPPGPDNPLGRHALGLSMPGYLLHGTNKPAGVGMRVSHGCIRLYPEDIEALFDGVPAGTEVTIVDQPVLAGWHGGVLYLEAHEPLAEDERDMASLAAQVIADALARAGRTFDVDPEAVEEVLAERRGIPLPIGLGGTSHAEYLAASRIVENTVVTESETTARLGSAVD